ncbi:MAG: hypothetical protein KatS3mg023_2368 [Armatimonadota bacterium]|nr:MAG: hypothetical protein KatS3mg023_2368 [Armatimonadota bacterium]
MRSRCSLYLEGEVPAEPLREVMFGSLGGSPSR